jgi:3-dehydroquinate synthase
MEPREYRAGLAEVLKYGVIREPAFFAWQEAHAEALARGEPEAVAQAVHESCRIKAEYVRADEFERGVRAHLNYGHTFGHALERETRYERYLHGEAVAIGMRMAADLARRTGALVDGDLIRRQDALLARFGLPTIHSAEDAIAEARLLAAHCAIDKKVSAGRIRFVLPIRLGEVAIVEDPDPEAVLAAFASAIAD